VVGVWYAERMKTSEQIRSAARRRAGKRLERRHPLLTAQLTQLYNDDKKLIKHTPRFATRRSEWVRADLQSKYATEYKQYLQEEKNVLRKD
jgi:hypothetical protein